jgi:hypothetical protein
MQALNAIIKSLRFIGIGSLLASEWQRLLLMIDLS